jgi:hypothetical protein
MAEKKGIERLFRDQARGGIDVIPGGEDRFHVVTPLAFDDGDLLPIVLKKGPEGSWCLSDEGHSLMRLSYEIDESDLRKPPRKEILDQTLTAFRIENRGGELVRALNGAGYGHALYGFVQALLKIDDIRLLSRDRVRSAFWQDFERFVVTRVPDERRTAKWHDPRRDPDRRYEVDYRINGRPQPIYMFALPTELKVHVATITILQLERWGLKGDYVGIFENQDKIPHKTLARFTDLQPTVFSNVAAAEDRFAAKFPDVVNA